MWQCRFGTGDVGWMGVLPRYVVELTRLCRCLSVAMGLHLMPPFMDQLHLKALIVSARNEQLRLWRRGMSELALPHDARDRIASDAAEKLARNKYEALAVDCDTIQGSAGLHGYPLGSHPSPRRGVRHSQHGAKSRGSALMGELHPYQPREQRLAGADACAPLAARSQVSPDPLAIVKERRKPTLAG